jgi:hypothetical protein
MNATESLLFNELFLKSLEDFFFKDDQASYNIDEILNGMPVVYNIGQLINSGVTFLVLKGTIAGDGNTHNQRFKLTNTGINARVAELEEFRINKEIDFEIKRQTLDQLKWDRIPKKYWLPISIGTSIIGGIVAHYLH